MNKKIAILSIGAAALLLLTFVPTIATEISGPVIGDMKSSRSLETRQSSEKIIMKVYHFKEIGDYEITEKEMNIEDFEILFEELENLDDIDGPLSSAFEAKLQLLKDYDLVESDLELDEIFDVSKLGERYITVEGEDFSADYAPLMFVGGGFGFGFGLPFFITSGTFLFLLTGFGMVFCYDWQNAILYQLQTLSFMPILVGYLGGFIGLALLPVVPGFFYSNAFVLGMASKTSWMQFPPEGNSTMDMSEFPFNIEDIPLDMQKTENEVMSDYLEQCRQNAARRLFN